MIKKFFMLFFVLLILFARPVMAQEFNQEEETNQQIIKDQIEFSGANNLYDSLPKDVKDDLNKNGIDEINPEKFMNFSIGNIFSAFINTFKDNVSFPLKMLFSILGIVLICALVNSLQSSMADNSYKKTFAVVAILTTCGIILNPIVSCIIETSKIIQQCAEFILSFIPVFTGIMIAGGKGISGATYSTVLFSVIQIVSYIASTILVPLLGIYLALSIVSCFSDTLNIDGLNNSIKKFVLWGLGLMLTVFIGLLTIQGFVANSADTLGIRTTKFFIGSFVPVVGGALNEAFSTIQGCMGILKSTVGVFGIIVIVITFVPILLKVTLLMISLNIGASLSDIFQVDIISKLLKNISSTLSLICGIIICFALFIIVSTTIMLLMGVGA